MENLQNNIDFLNAISLENYIDYCKDFFMKRGYLINQDSIYVQFRIDYKIPGNSRLKSNGITTFKFCYDNGTDKVVSLKIDYKGMEFEDLVENKMLEKYKFSQAQLLLNTYLMR